MRLIIQLTLLLALLFGFALPAAGQDSPVSDAKEVVDDIRDAVDGDDDKDKEEEKADDSKEDDKKE